MQFNTDLAERERQRLEWEEKKRRWEAERRRQELEEEQVKSLLSSLATWQKSQEILRFAEVVEARLQSSALENSERVTEWLSWARQ